MTDNAPDAIDHGVCVELIVTDVIVPKNTTSPSVSAEHNANPMHTADPAVNAADCTIAFVTALDGVVPDPEAAFQFATGT